MVKVVDEAIPAIPMPVPAMIPRPTNRGINSVALFDCVCVASGMVSVWWLGTVVI